MPAHLAQSPGIFKSVNWTLWVALCEDDVETLSFFTRLSFLVSHLSILNTLFVISFYVCPIWIQKKRSTYFAGWFVSARYSTLSLNKLWPLPISYMYWNNLFVNFTANFPEFLDLRIVFSEIEIFWLNFRRNVMRCWICGFIVTFEWHLTVF